MSEFTEWFVIKRIKSFGELVYHSTNTDDKAVRVEAEDIVSWIRELEALLEELDTVSEAKARKAEAGIDT